MTITPNMLPRPKPALVVEPTPYTPYVRVCRKQYAATLAESKAQYASKTRKFGSSEPVRFYGDCHCGGWHYTRMV